MAIAITILEGEQFFGNKRVVRGTIKLDNSYPTGGELLKPADIGLGTIDWIDFGMEDGIHFNYDYTNEKLMAYAGQLVAVATGIIKDDDSAETNGTDVYVHVDEVLEHACIGHLESICANNADAAFEIGASGPQVMVKDDDAADTGGFPLYCDDDGATADERLQCNNSTHGKDIYIMMSDGRFIKIKHAGSPAGATVHFDDNGGTASERMLSVTDGDADTTFASDDELTLNQTLIDGMAEVANTTDLSGVTALRFRAEGQ